MTLAVQPALPPDDVSFHRTPNLALVPNSPPRRVLPVLTHSEKKCFRACRRKHYLRYRLLKRPMRSSDPLRFGSGFHRGLEVWWRAAKDGIGGDARLALALDEIREAFTAPVDRAKAEALMLGYHVRWIDEVVEVLAVEVEFTTPIVNPDTGAESRTFQLGGKIDAIARLADGLVYVVEHKTSGENIEAGSDYWKRLRLDAQVSDYFVGARSLGFEIAGCLYDVIGKPRLELLEATPVEKRQYTKKEGRLYAGQREFDETIEEYGKRVAEHVADNLDRYFRREPIVRLADEEEDAARDTWQVAREIREADLAVRYPRNPEACVQWGQACEFFPVCTREADVNDATLFRTAGSAHEELSQPQPPVTPTTYEALDL